MQFTTVIFFPRKPHWLPMRLMFHILPSRNFKLGIYETWRRKPMRFLRVFNYNIHDGIFLGMGDPNLPQEALSCYN